MTMNLDQGEADFTGANKPANEVQVETDIGERKTQ